MKKITKNTILKQGDKTYQAVECTGIIYWVDKPLDEDGCIVPGSIVALTKPKFTNKPIIDLDIVIGTKAIQMSKKFASKKGETDYTLGYISGHQESPNQYTEKDIERAILFGINLEAGNVRMDWLNYSTPAKQFTSANFIEVIEVDEQFNIISYE